MRARRSSGVTRVRSTAGTRGLEVRAGRVARLDVGREARTGVPEIVLGEGKRPEDLATILHALRARGHSAIVSRPTDEQREFLRRSFPRATERPRSLAGGRILWMPVRRPRPAERPGLVAIVAAGTSDVPLAEEAAAVLRLAGIAVLLEYDVGVAGLHRLLSAVARTERRRPQVYLAFAGREGALPTVLAGLVRAPVIGVPTSVGYGRGGRGEAALSAMLQSCAPIAVVNIDAAVPAALFALQLLAGAERAPVGPHR